MTDEQIEAVLHVFGTNEERKRWNEYKNLRDNFDEIVKQETQKLLKEVNKRLEK